MVIDIAAGALNALRDAMNYSFSRRPGMSECRSYINDKFAIPLISAEYAKLFGKIGSFAKRYPLEGPEKPSVGNEKG